VTTVRRSETSDGERAAAEFPCAWQCLRHALLAALLLFALGASVRADGGVIILDREASPFLITVFAAPAPLRAGPVDMSVLVRDASSGQPILDAEVHLTLRLDAGEGGGPPEDEHADHRGHEGHAGMNMSSAMMHGDSGIDALATREQATNKLLRAAEIELPEPGIWNLRVSVSRGSSSAEISGELVAGPPLPAWISRWQVIVMPLVVVLLFLANKLLADSRRRSSRG
jgi:hypothetical protein